MVGRKSADRTCLLPTDGRQINPHNSTIVSWMAHKSITHARYEWPIKLGKMKCHVYIRFSTYGRKLSILLLFKNVYIHVHCTLDRNELKCKTMKTLVPKKSIANCNRKKSPCQMKVCIQLSACQLEGSKRNSALKGLRVYLRKCTLHTSHLNGYSAMG